MIGNESEEMIAVSIVCTTYNHEKYIEKTLEGFVSQEIDFTYEIIVHDDASNDNTYQVVSKYMEKYPNIRCVRQKTNQYYIKDLMCDILLPIVRGKYIALCEGDDFWNDSNKLKIAYNTLESNPDCSMLVHRVKCCKEDGSADSRLIPEDYYGITGDKIFKPEDISKLMFCGAGYPFHTSSYVFRRENLVKASPLNWVSRIREIDVIKSAILSGNIIFLDKAMSTRRLNSLGGWNSSMDSQDKWDKLLMDDIVVNERYDSFSNNRFHKDISLYILNSCIYLLKLYPDFAIEHIGKLRNVEGIYNNIKIRLIKCIPYTISRIMNLLNM